MACITNPQEMNMLTKSIIALALVVGTASGAFAASKKYSTNPGHEVYNTSGQYIGSDPDAHVRSMLAHDPTGSD